MHKAYSAAISVLLLMLSTETVAVVLLLALLFALVTILSRLQTCSSL